MNISGYRLQWTPVVYRLHQLATRIPENWNIHSPCHVSGFFARLHQSRVKIPPGQ